MLLDFSFKILIDLETKSGINDISSSDTKMFLDQHGFHADSIKSWIIILT
jgi:hypothetical protein